MDSVKLANELLEVLHKHLELGESLGYDWYINPNYMAEIHSAIASYNTYQHKDFDSKTDNIVGDMIEDCYGR